MQLTRRSFLRLSSLAAIIAVVPSQLLRQRPDSMPLRVSGPALSAVRQLSPAQRLHRDIARV